MNVTALVVGLALQAGSLLAAWASVRLLWAASWLGILVVSVPMFAASPFFLMNSGLPLPARLALSFWIVLIPAAHLLFAAAETLCARRQVFLVPEGFRGRVTVRFWEKDGEAPIEKGRTLVLQVAADGTLRTRAEEAWFWNRSANAARDRKREFYRIDEAGRRTAVGRVEVGGVGEHYQDGRLIQVDFTIGIADTHPV